MPPPPTTTEASSVLDNWTVDEDDREEDSRHRKKGRRNRARNRNKDHNKYDVHMTTANSRFTQPPYVLTMDEEEYDEFGERIVKERKNSQKQKSGRSGAGARRGMTSGGLLVIPVLALVASVV